MADFAAFGASVTPLVFTSTTDFNGGFGETSSQPSQLSVEPGMTVTFAGPVIRGGIHKINAGTLVLSNPGNTSLAGSTSTPSH